MIFSSVSIEKSMLQVQYHLQMKMLCIFFQTGPVSTELKEPYDRRPLITDGGETTEIHNGDARRHSYGSTHSSND